MGPCTFTNRFSLPSSLASSGRFSRPEPHNHICLAICALSRIPLHAQSLKSFCARSSWRDVQTVNLRGRRLSEVGGFLHCRKSHQRRMLRMQMLRLPRISLLRLMRLRLLFLRNAWLKIVSTGMKWIADLCLRHHGLRLLLLLFKFRQTSPLQVLLLYLLPREVPRLQSRLRARSPFDLLRSCLIVATTSPPHYPTTRLFDRESRGINRRLSRSLRPPVAMRKMKARRTSLRDQESRFCDLRLRRSLRLLLLVRKKPQPTKLLDRENRSSNLRLSRSLRLPQAPPTSLPDHESPSSNPRLYP